MLLGTLDASCAADAPVNAYDGTAPSKAFLECLDLKKKNQLAEALICFSDLVKEPNTTPTQEKIYAYRMLADISAGEGDLSFSRSILVHALKEIPDSADLQFLLCRVLYLEKKLETAIGVCNKGFSMLNTVKKAENDLHLQALITVGDSYMALGKPEAARAAYKSLVRSNLQAFREIGEKRLATMPLRKKYINARVSDPIYKSYLQGWLRQVQERGNASYPEELKEKKITGNVLLSVEIRVDGSLADIEIRRSSGHQALDEAAKRIAMQAAPFSPFPSEIMKDVDILNITATWKFASRSGPKLE